MKKMTLILGAMLVSLSMLAHPMVKAGSDAKRDVKFAASLDAKFQKALKAQAVQKTPATITNFDAFHAVKALNSQLPNVRRVAREEADPLVTVTAEEAGYGIAKLGYQASEGADQLVYMTYIMLANEAKTVVAYTNPNTISAISKTLTSTYNVFYIATKGDKYGYYNPDFASSIPYLPKGKYIFGLAGYALTSDNQVDLSAIKDAAFAEFEITLDGTEYAITDLNVTVAENKQMTISWNNASGVLPEGAVYEVLVYGLLADEATADSEEITTNTWTTPEETAFEDNTTYEVEVHLWHPGGYNYGKFGSKYITIGTDPNAPTNLVATPDNETMTATLTWEGSLTYYIPTLKDANGKEWGYTNAYQFPDGGWYCADKTLYTEALPAGTYTWEIIACTVEDQTLYHASAPIAGPAFEIKDAIAPVITAVNLAKASDTEAYLSIEVSDNAPDVTPASLSYDVTGDLTLTGAKLEEDGTLKLTDLSSKLYKIQITATDPSGNKSEAFAYEFTPVKDEEAPKNLAAEIAEGNVFDKYVIINVSADDNIATAEQLLYTITFADETAVNLYAKEGQLVLEGLTPETAYAITISVKDFGGNVCTESVKLEFTTLPLIPIVLEAYNGGQAAYYSQYKAYQIIFFDEFEEDKSAVAIILRPESKTTLANVYLPDGKTFALGGIFYIKEDGSEVEITADKVEIKYIGAIAEDLPALYYEVWFEGTGDDGNLYQLEITTYIIAYADTWQNWITLNESFKDTDAPVLYVNEDYPVEGHGTSAEILFQAYDGPYVRMEYCKDEECTQIGRIYDEVYTDFTKLTLEIQTEDGTVLASAAEGSIENTPTLDEDGDYYFTATVGNLEPNTDYVVYIYAKDNAGNESDRLQVSFNSGRPDAINQVVSDVTVKKVIRNGQLLIKRGEKVYNALGAELK